MSIAKRKLFENKRKAHYNEFMAVKLARQLMNSDDEDEDDEDATQGKNVPSDVVEGILQWKINCCIILGTIVFFFADMDTKDSTNDEKLPTNMDVTGDCHE